MLVNVRRCGAHHRIQHTSQLSASTKSQARSPRHAQSPHQKQVSYACITAVSGTVNSLFKVLCTFPSRYLFAIGLELVLSFRWNVPPNLRCRPRQHDSENTDRTQPLSDVRRDSHPLSHPLPRDLHLRGHWNRVYTPQRENRSFRFSMWPHPCSFAITKGILFSFDSSAH